MLEDNPAPEQNFLASSRCDGKTGRRLFLGGLGICLCGILLVPVGAEVISPAARGNGATASASPAGEACELGILILRVQQVLQQWDQSAEALKIITALGHDSRYYVLTRGWLSEELRGVKSQAEAQPDSAMQAQLQAQIQFLQKAIRLLDLE